MNDKSHVGMEARLCIVCGHQFETGTILLDARLRDVLDRTQVVGWGMCPAHQQLYDDGYVALVAIDYEKSTPHPGGVVTPEAAYRLGGVAHVAYAAWPRLFDVPPPEHGVAFCGQDVVRHLEEVQNKIEEEIPTESDP
jgi:hypothetical protein